MFEVFFNFKGAFSIIIISESFEGQAQQNLDTMSYISQSLESDPPAQSKGSNSVVIEVSDPQTHGVGNKRYTDYLVKTTVSLLKPFNNWSASVIVCLLFQTNLPGFKARDLSVRRRFSEFEWLRSKIETDLKVSC